MAKYSIIDNEVGESWDCFPVQSGKGGQQRSRNKETLLAFMRFCLEEKRPFGWWTFGVTWGVEGYNAFQAALDYFLRGLPGRYAYAIEIGEKGKKLHVHMILQEFEAIEKFKERWSGCTGIKNPNVDVCAIPGWKKMEDGTLREFKDFEEVAYYMAKYATKAKDGLNGVRTFRTSKYLKRDIESFFEKKEFTFFLSKEYYESKKFSDAYRRRGYDGVNVSANTGKGKSQG